MSRNRTTALLVTIVLAIAANIAISQAAGISTQPDVPRPNAGISTQPDVPRPNAGISTQPDVPRPGAGISTQPDVPRP